MVVGFEIKRACRTYLSSDAHKAQLGLVTFLTARLAAFEVADRDLAVSVLSSSYWGREDDLDTEYSLIFQQKNSSMLAHYLRRWLNINPTLTHVTSRVW